MEVVSVTEQVALACFGLSGSEYAPMLAIRASQFVPSPAEGKKVTEIFSSIAASLKYWTSRLMTGEVTRCPSCSATVPFEVLRNNACSLRPFEER